MFDRRTVRQESARRTLADRVMHDLVLSGRVIHDPALSSRALHEPALSGPAVHVATLSGRVVHDPMLSGRVMRLQAQSGRVRAAGCGVWRRALRALAGDVLGRAVREGGGLTEAVAERLLHQSTYHFTIRLQCKWIYWLVYV